MKGCGRLLAGIALILFILSATSAVLLINIRQYLFSSMTYSDAIQQEGIYHALPSLVANQLVYSITVNPCMDDPSHCEGQGPADSSREGGGGPPGYFSNLSSEVWESVISALIDPIWIESQIEDVLDQVFSLLTQDSQQETIVISLEEIRNQIRGDAGFQAVLQVIEAQPACTPEQVSEISLAFSAAELSDTVLQCKPPVEVLSLIEPEIRSGLADASNDLPSRLALDVPQELTGSGSAASVLSMTRAVMSFAPWIALFWLLTVTVFGVRDLRSWAGWWGTGFFFSGLATFGFGITAGPLFDWSLERFVLSSEMRGLSPALVSQGLRVAIRIMDGFSMRLLVYAGILLGLGLLLLIFRFFVRDRSNRQIGSTLTRPRA